LNNRIKKSRTWPQEVTKRNIKAATFNPIKHFYLKNIHPVVVASYCKEKQTGNWTPLIKLLKNIGETCEICQIIITLAGNHKKIDDKGGLYLPKSDLMTK
jgi:hypothetical protein